jgi:hypothetical protein
MAKILDFFDGSQSASVPTIGNIEASALSTYASDAEFESFNGPGGPGDVYINTTDNAIHYWNTDEDAWVSLISSTSMVDASNIADGSVSNTEFQQLNGVSGNIQTQLDNNSAAAAAAQAAIDAHLVDDFEVHPAEGITVTPSGNLTSVNAQDALEELQTDIDDHLSDATDAHDASAISNVPSGNLSATDVQSALDELQSDVDGRILYTEKGANNGVATLDGGGKVPLSQLPSAVMTYEGVWNASTNSPTLADGAGDVGMVYRVGTAGTQNLGSGSISYDVGDYVILNSSLIWEKSDTTDAVSSVNGQTGIVVLDTDDVSEGSTNLYFTDARARAAVVDDAIVDGVTNKAPSQNAVFDALATKQATGNYITSLTGDVAASGPGSATATIQSDVVDNTKLSNMATQTIKGRTTAGTGDPEDLSATQATAILNTFVGDSGSGGTKGLVPAPAAGDAAAGKFLKADGTFAVPSSGNSGPSWTKYTVSESAFTAAATSEDIELFSLAAKGVIHAVVIKHTTAFSGGSLTGFTLSVGISGNLTKHASAFDVFQATGNTISQTSNTVDVEDFSSAVSIRLAAVSTGANVSAATAGSVDVYVLTSTLP